MVDIREADDADDRAAGERPTSSQQQPSHAGGQPNIVEFLKGKPVDTVLWLLRCATVCFTLFYAVPIFGLQTQSSSYQKALIAGAATNALRLHQRLGGITLSREFLQRMFLEDACHYFFYCILFMGSSPVTMVLMPIVLFALLHAASFTVQVLGVLHMHGGALHRAMMTVTEQYAHTLLNVIACAEIFMMPMVVIMTFMGQCSMLLPFIYYRFITLRYMSRRNPNTRIAFNQMRQALDQATTQPRCPPVVRNIVCKCIAFIERLAPETAA